MRVREKILLQVFYLSASFHCYVAVQSLSEQLDYCAANIGSNRDVPDLSCAELEIVSSISQVQLLMRHGARIPWTAAQCWGSYNVSWTGCDVYVLETPMAVGEPLARMQFKKVYDGSDNEIHGTCQLGQLLHDGKNGGNVIVKCKYLISV